MYYQDLYPLICFLPRYADTVAQQSTADMLPLWQASEDGEHPYEHGNVRAHPTRTASEPATIIGGGADTQNEKLSSGWFGSGSSKERGRSRPKSFDPERALPSVHAHRPLKPSRNPPASTLYDYIPILLIFKPVINLFKTKKIETGRTASGRKIKPETGDSNVPLEITLFLSK